MVFPSLLRTRNLPKFTFLILESFVNDLIISALRIPCIGT